jgi:hypothetical protein
VHGLYEGLFGLIGVVVGAVLSLASTYLTARRGELRSTKRARRLVAAELETMRTHLLVILDERRVPERLTAATEPDAYIPTLAWRVWRDSLAGGLDEDLWIELPRIYAAAETLRETLVNRRGGEPLEPREIEVIQLLVRAAALAEARLVGKSAEPALLPAEPAAAPHSRGAATATTDLYEAIRDDAEVHAFASRLASRFADADHSALAQALARGDEQAALRAIEISPPEFEAMVAALERRAAALAASYPEIQHAASGDG